MSFKLILLGFVGFLAAALPIARKPSILSRRRGTLGHISLKHDQGQLSLATSQAVHTAQHDLVNADSQAPDWHQFIGGTGSVADYMKTYAGGATADAGTGTVGDYMKAYGGGAAAPDAGTGSVGDYMAQYNVGAQAPPAQPHPEALPVGSSVADYMNLYASPAAPQVSPVAPAAPAAGAPLPPGATVDQYMAQYAAPAAPVAALGAVPGAAPPMPDWSKGEWSKYIGGTGGVDKYMAAYSTPGAAPDTGTGSVAQYMAPYAGAAPDTGTGTVVQYMAPYAASSAISVQQLTPALPLGRSRDCEPCASCNC